MKAFRDQEKSLGFKCARVGDEEDGRPLEVLYRLWRTGDRRGT